MKLIISLPPPTLPQLACGDVGMRALLMSLRSFTVEQSSKHFFLRNYCVVCAKSLFNFFRSEHRLTIKLFGISPLATISIKTRSTTSVFKKSIGEIMEPVSTCFDRYSKLFFFDNVKAGKSFKSSRCNYCKKRSMVGKKADQG